MTSRINTVAFQGIDVLPIDVQAQVASGLPAFTLVGLPDKAVGESRERVRAALNALGLALPPKRITLNLAPADVQKEGSHFDLPIACALLVAMGILPGDEMAGYVVLGELGLDGTLAPVAGVLAAAISAHAADKGLICPGPQGGEAAWSGTHVLAPASLLALINHFKGTQILSPPTPEIAEEQGRFLDLRDIKGQESAKRALEVAAAGGHNLLMIGPPGSGKSMLAARLPGLLPPLDPAEALEVSMIHSVAGALEGGRLLRQRPFRDPHHSASVPALVGGGMRARPGEISLAHNGVLFLDELPEFNRGALEALRQPLETGRASVARANAHVTYPSRFQLVAAMNPCKCGYLGDPALACNKAPKCGADYQARISGPHVRPHRSACGSPCGQSRRSVPAAACRRLGRGRRPGRRRPRHSSRALRRSACAHQCRGRWRIVGAGGFPDAAGRALLTEAAERMRLSARGYHRVLRVARTLADLDGGGPILRLHIAEALSTRRVIAGRNSLLAG